MFVEGSMAGGVDESWTSPRIGKRSRSKSSSGLQQIADLKFSVQHQFKKKNCRKARSYSYNSCDYTLKFMTITQDYLEMAACGCQIAF